MNKSQVFLICLILFLPFFLTASKDADDLLQIANVTSESENSSLDLDKIKMWSGASTGSKDLKILEYIKVGESIRNMSESMIRIEFVGGSETFAIAANDELQITDEIIDRVERSQPGPRQRIISLVSSYFGTNFTISYHRGTDIEAPLFDGSPMPLIPADIESLPLVWRNGLPPFRVRFGNADTTIEMEDIPEPNAVLALPELTPPMAMLTIEDSTGRLRQRYILQVAPAAPDLGQLESAGTEHEVLERALSLLERDGGAWRVLAAETLRRESGSNLLAAELANGLLDGSIRVVD